MGWRNKIRVKVEIMKNGEVVVADQGSKGSHLWSGIQQKYFTNLVACYHATSPRTTASLCGAKWRLCFLVIS